MVFCTALRSRNLTAAVGKPSKGSGHEKGVANGASLMAKCRCHSNNLVCRLPKDMEALADAIIEGVIIQQRSGHLFDMMARCTACRDIYRLKEARNATISE